MIEETRDQQIGIRFTKSEMKVIEVFAENRSLNKSDFIRQSLYNFILQIKEQYTNVDYNLLSNILNNMKDSLKDVKSSN